jgi:hypothetical protein
VISPPAVDGRRVESFVQELRRFAPHYTPDLNISDPQSAAVALMRIFAQLTEIVAVRLDQAPQKDFVAFLDKLGITLLPARPATAAVTFRLASGFKDPVRVPLGTRVTAPGVDDETPFETMNELLAIPGGLTVAYGVDPLKDKIFSPPPGFLKQEPRAPSELSYQIQSFVPASSNRLQLNHTAELEPESFIRIGCKEKHVVQKVDEGNFVTLYEPVEQDFQENTIVVPIRNFEVFDGIDRQEHVLYIAHENLFTIKEEVEITLDIELKEGEAAVDRLDLVWQFWTKDDTKVPEEDEHWERLQVKSDGTAGLSSSGRLVLVKKGTVEGTNLEIKPRKVAGRESRWIRAELKDKLPVDSRELPEIETIEVSVNTQLDDKGKPIGIPADQGFYNATPLDVQVASGIGFFPFGTEPRQFDQFYIGSKEAFSKKSAKVDLNFDLDLQTLGAPSLVRSSAGLRAYSIGLRRQIFELDVKNATFSILENPFDAPTPERPEGSHYFPVEDSVPSAITNTAGDQIYLFINTEDALDADPGNRARKLWVHRHLTGAPILRDLDAPGPASGKRTILFNPAGVVLPGSTPAFARVFAVGGDGSLHSRDIPADLPLPLLTNWQGHTSLQGQPWKSSPFVTSLGSKHVVFITGSDGFVHRLTIDPAVTPPDAWLRLTPTSGSSFSATSKPFAQCFGANDAKVFVVGKQGNAFKLFECDTSAPIAGEFAWKDLGQPPAGISTDGEPSAPSGFVEKPSEPINASTDTERKHIFLRGADNRLWERLDDAAGPVWMDRTRTEDPSLRDSPAVHVDQPPTVGTTTVHIISASQTDSLVEWEFEIYSGNNINPDKLSILVKSSASSVDGFYTGNLEVNPATGPTQNVGIVAYDGALRLVRVDAPVTPPLVATTKLKVTSPSVDDLKPAQPETDDLLVLHNAVPGRRDARVRELRIGNTVVAPNNIEEYSRLTGVVQLNTTLPTVPFAYSLVVEVTGANKEFRSGGDTSNVPQLSWEYWNGNGWLSIRNVVDTTHSLLGSGDVTFDVPKDIEATEVAGQENFWIRTRLVGGDYGRETFRIEPVQGGGQKIVSEKNSLRPPKVQKLRISYKAAPVAPDICLTFNNLDYVDQTAACAADDSHFPPFETLEDKSFTIFFGFDKTFKTGPVRLLIDAAERNYNESKPPEFAWSFRRDRKWKELDAEDGSNALMRQGILTINASEELTRETRFGESLFWIKGSLRLDRALADVDTEIEATKGPCGEPLRAEPRDPCAGEPENGATKPCSEADHQLHGCSCCEEIHTDDPCAQFMGTDKASKAVAAASAQYPSPLLLGIFLNTVWAVQGETITEEIVGSGDGEQNQTHPLQHGDVLEGEDIRVEEALSTEERERIERELGEASVVDREDLGGTWVRWKSVKALFDCGPQDRCYEIDRAAGILRFGDGEHGTIVPAGVDNIRAFSYRTGGGLIGNVQTSQIQSLATAVAGIESVFNPTPAGGGSDKADTDEMLTIGPRRLSHRDRAVSVEDFEELALEASRQVAKVRCLRTTNLVPSNTDLPDPCDPRQLHQPIEERGWVSLIIVPDSAEPRPCPSLQLRRAVREYLYQRAPSLVAFTKRIVVRPPDYVIVSVYAKVLVTTLEKAAIVETEARTRLEKFLHPVHGGPDGMGWEFGRPVTKSDIFALLEEISDIDRVEDLEFRFRGQTNPDRVEIGPNELLASGEHNLAIKKG